MVLAPGESYTWMPKPAYPYTEAGDYKDTAKVVVHNLSGDSLTKYADATVTVTDVDAGRSRSARPRARRACRSPAATFTFTYVVTNNSVEDVTITSVTDSVIGKIDLPADVTLAPGESSAAMTATKTYTEAGSYDNTVTAVAVDNEGKSGEASRQGDSHGRGRQAQDLGHEGREPRVQMTSPAALFTYTYVVTNNSVEAVTLKSVTDSVIGDIQLPAELTLQPGASSGPMTGTGTYTEKGVYPNTVKAMAVDNEGNEAPAEASASVEVKDVLPTITVTKVATPLEMDEPGGYFAYAIEVTNTSPEPVTLGMLTDTLPGGIVVSDPTAAGQVLPPGGTWLWNTGFTYSEAGLYTDIAYAAATDNDGNSCDATAQATVKVVDVMPW